MPDPRPLLTIALLAACGSPSVRTAAPEIEHPPAAEIVIGHFTPMSGASALFGIATDRGVQLAVDEQNAAGGIDGVPIRLVTLDDEGMTSVAERVVHRLIEEEHALAILGEVGSPPALAGGDVAQAAGVPMISPAAVNPMLSERGDMLFQISLLTEPQGHAAAKFAADMWFEPKVVVLREEDSDYSRELSHAFEDHLAALGGKVVLEHDYTGGALDPAAVVTALAGVDADVIYLPGYYPHVISIIRAARDAGIDTPFLGADGWDSPEIATLGAEALLGCFYTNQFSIHAPEVVRFVEAYGAAYHTTPDALAALGYDAAMLLFDAMARAPSHTGAELAAAIAATTFHGVAGTLTFGADRLPSKPVLVLGFDQGTEIVWTRIDPP